MSVLKLAVSGLIISIGVLFIGSCAGSGPGNDAGNDSGSQPGAAGEPTLTVKISTTELVKGANRITLGIYRSAKDQVRDAKVSVKFKNRSHELDAGIFQYAGDLYDGKGLYVGKATFDEEGAWLALVSINEKGRTLSTEVPFNVLDKSETPAVGEKAPASENFVPESYESADYFCSATPPCSMHHDEIEHSLEEHRPMLIFFAAPGRCVSELCGPQLAVTEKLKNKYGDKVAFIHVEIFTDPESEDVNPVAYEWNLPTEPWTFVVDKDGIIRDKFEGPALETELAEVLSQVR